MDMPMNRLMGLIGTVMGLCFSAHIFAATAATCPTSLHQDKHGYWTSNDSPGWKSPRPSDKNVTIETKDFGGAVYSPQKKRLACVYRGSDGNWVALLSSIYHPFNEDDLTSKGWQYSQKHKDYVCGQPKNTLQDCEFDVKK